MPNIILKIPITSNTYKILSEDMYKLSKYNFRIQRYKEVKEFDMAYRYANSSKNVCILEDYIEKFVTDDIVTKKEYLYSAFDSLLNISYKDNKIIYHEVSFVFDYEIIKFEIDIIPENLDRIYVPYKNKTYTLDNKHRDIDGNYIYVTHEELKEYTTNEFEAIGCLIDLENEYYEKVNEMNNKSLEFQTFISKLISNLFCKKEEKEDTDNMEIEVVENNKKETIICSLIKRLRRKDNSH